MSLSRCHKILHYYSQPHYFGAESVAEAELWESYLVLGKRYKGMGYGVWVVSVHVLLLLVVADGYGA